MKTPQPVTLSGRSVRLEPMRADHAEQLWDAGRHPELWRISLARMQSLEDMRTYVEHALERQANGTAIPFVQVALGSEEIVGSTRFASIEVEHCRLEIGWTWLAPRYQRSGINTEAKLLLLTHAFEELGCLRVEFKADATNTRSIAAMERIGAQYEGTLRRHMRRADGTQRDTVYYSVIAEEWLEVKASLASKLR